MHAADLRRCLIACDVAGAVAVWRQVAPHLAGQEPADALVCLHMARVEAKSIPQRLRDYSMDWLRDRGLEKIDGKWQQGLPRATGGIVEAVGIASKSSDPVFSRRIVRGMEDALLNGLAKGIIEPPMQRELMLKARDRVRFRARRA